ncbi:hypothetical protein MOQ72_39375 [Saccharopolyspora sp. K220]|uniref:hypothetical protein n=1 Tax=Saccharopolyspora soli TaxID=2926618 RepID=UPI001F58A563|nr:hypothetical protein [Saccharopolyspora soli]MCI2423489.1 hypothetical protein [Saccharopolyspora soli]
MFLELSTASIIFAVRVAIDEIPDRTLFGSDAPYGDPVLARATIERVTALGPRRDQVLGGTLATSSAADDSGQRRALRLLDPNQNIQSCRGSRERHLATADRRS